MGPGKAVAAPSVEAAPEMPWREPRTNWMARIARHPAECLDLTEFYNGHLETGGNRWTSGTR